MTSPSDQTPQTEAGPYSKIIDGALLAMEREYERGLADGVAQARTEALDVDVLARAMNDVDDRGLPMSPWNIAVAYRAILAGETE